MDEKFLGIAMFKVVSETLYPKYEGQMPESVRVNLYAYLQQSTVGPNLDPPPNCILSFFSPPSTNVKWCVINQCSIITNCPYVLTPYAPPPHHPPPTHTSPNRQTWRNLATMTKTKAMKSFMEMYMDTEPGFQVPCAILAYT